jgi:hypothetical protein
MLKLAIVGHARHGKDTVCEILASKYNVTFTSSSAYCCKCVIYPVLKDKYCYTSDWECYVDRVNHRAEWFDLISAYNADDPARLGKEILEHNGIYCGIRSAEELLALKSQGLVDLVIWVDASKRLPPEDSSSITIDKSMADIILDNDGSLEELNAAVCKLPVTRG